MCSYDSESFSDGVEVGGLVIVGGLVGGYQHTHHHSSFFTFTDVAHLINQLHACATAS